MIRKSGRKFVPLQIDNTTVMIIHNIELYNWKNFQQCSVTLAERCFIVGANATGKSNFLDAIRFLHDIVRQGGGLQTAVEDRGGITKIRCLAARAQTDIKITVTLREQETSEDKWIYSLNFEHTGGGILRNAVRVISEQVYAGGAHECILNRTKDSPGEDEETLKYTHLEQANANQKFREIKDTFLRVDYLNLIPQMVRESGSAIGKEDYYGRGFLAQLARLNENTRNFYLKKVNEVIKLAVPQLDELTFVKDENGLYHLEAGYLHWRAQGCKQNEMQFSDGTLRLIGFLFAILSGSGIVLLEEPEINLHPGVVAQLPEFIAKMQRVKKRQTLITTHSYDILSDAGIAGNEVILLENTCSGTTARPISEIEEMRNILQAGLSVADAVIPRTKPSGVEDIAYIDMDRP